MLELNDDEVNLIRDIFFDLAILAYIEYSDPDCEYRLLHNKITEVQDQSYQKTQP